MISMVFCVQVNAAPSLNSNNCWNKKDNVLNYVSRWLFILKIYSIAFWIFILLYYARFTIYLNYFLRIFSYKRLIWKSKTSSIKTFKQKRLINSVLLFKILFILKAFFSILYLNMILVVFYVQVNASLSSTSKYVLS